MYKRVSEVPKVTCHVIMLQCLQNPSPVVEGIGGGDTICKSSPFKEQGSPQPSIRHCYSHLIIQTGTEGVQNLQDEKAALLWRYSSTSVVKGAFWHPLLKEQQFSYSEWIKIQTAGKMNLSFYDLLHGGSWKQLEFLLVFCHSPA